MEKITVKCLDCEETFLESDIELDGIDTGHCPYCGSTNMMDIDEKLEATK